MLKTLPFTALRTLESVVRLRGFGRAAEELNVTQSAVSQHVKTLEDWLGQRLLIRQGRRTDPTEMGERLAEATRTGFGSIEALCDEIRGARSTPDRGILVASPPGFAFLWLLPRLLRFDEQYPDVPVSISTDPLSRSVQSSEADVLICYSSGGFPGLHAEQMMSETMAPVCTPQIASQLHAVNDLSRQTVLLDSLDQPGQPSTWQVWASETGQRLPHVPRTRSYGQANMVIQAAIGGLGVAMGRAPLVLDALQSGQLVHPFPHMAPSQFSYWFVCRHEALQSHNVLAFRTWLHETVAQNVPPP